MINAVGHEELFAALVVRDRGGPAEIQRSRAERRASDGPQRRHVSVRHERKRRGRRISEVGHPELLVLGVEKDTGRVAQTRLGSLENPGRRHIALYGRDILEDQHRRPDVVGDVELSSVGVQLHRGRPVQLRFLAGNDAKRSVVPVGIERVDLDRRWIVRTGACHPEVAVMSPRIDVQEPVLLVDRDSVRSVEPASVALEDSDRLLVT